MHDIGRVATPVRRAKLPAVWVASAQPRSTPSSRECQASAEVIHLKWGGRGSNRDQRIIDPYVWTVPVVCCLLLCHKVVGRSALRPEPDNSGPFRIIGVE
jgi:hypothetical protein